MIRAPFAVLFLCLAVAPAARAGISYLGPFDLSPPCIAPEQVVVHMTSPTTTYVGHPACESLCKKAVSVCKQEVKVSFSCYSNVYASSLAFGKKACDAQYGHDPLAKTCKTSVGNSVNGQRDILKNTRELGLGNCDDWGAICTDSCTHP